MNITKEAKQSKEDANAAKVKQVYDLLIASKEGLTAAAVGEKIGVKDTRQVRELLREAIRKAEKEGYTTKRGRIAGQANKVYQIIGKVGPDAGPKAPTSPLGSSSLSSRMTTSFADAWQYWH